MRNRLIDRKITAKTNETMDKKITAEPNETMDRKITAKPNEMMDRKITAETNETMDRKITAETNETMDRKTTGEINRTIDRTLHRLGIAFFIGGMSLCSCAGQSSQVKMVIEGQSSKETNGVSSEGSNQNISDSMSPVAGSYVKVDLDLTEMSSTMIYAEVYNMMVAPDDYVGKIVRMNGAFAVYQNTETGQLYYACVIKDATACCTQGIEFLLQGDPVFPDDYPDNGTEITVTGEFETYEEDGFLYCRLKNATLEEE